MKKKLYFFYLCLACSIISCTKDDNPTSGRDFNRTEMLGNITDNLIIPSYQDLKEEARVLNAFASTFTKDVNETNLILLQNALIETCQVWNATQAFNFIGPAADASFSMNVNNYPADYSQIETHINSSAGIDQNFIESLTSREKGLPALEYLIFSKNGNSEVLAKFTIENQNRKLYLTALTENILEKASNMESAWVSSGSNYQETFLSKTGTDAGSSTNLLANSIIQAVEDIKNIKIGVALGKKGGGLQPEKVEAYYSEHSIELIKADLNAIENAFKGSGVAGDKAGFDDYLNSVNANWEEDQLLSDRISLQFETIRATLNEISAPLDQAVVSETAKVDKLYGSLTSLVSLLKGEMVSNLGLSITYTDNDGD